MAQRPPVSSALLAVALELIAVAVFTLLAGASEEAGTVMVLMMVGFWLIYLITESNIIIGAVGALNSLLSNPMNKKTNQG